MEGKIFGPMSILNIESHSILWIYTHFAGEMLGLPEDHFVQGYRSADERFFLFMNNDGTTCQMADTEMHVGYPCKTKEVAFEIAHTLTTPPQGASDGNRQG
jgi:hypothetical protein